jgi:hypothetical protein
MRATLTQHPVGQGGLMSGLLEISDGRLHWAYDCGSNQTDALNREIAIVAAREDLDLLFLSHLDSDHVSGIDSLLAKTHVKEVVLPYLNDLDRLIAAAHDAATGALTGGFLTFMTDIAGWFGARGVERVTYITPRDDDDGGEVGDGPDLPRGGGGDGKGPIHTEWRGEPTADFSERSFLDTLSRKPVVQQFSAHASLHLIAGYNPLDWVLAPYAHRPSDERLKVFDTVMSRKFGSHYTSQLNGMIGDKRILSGIRDCYDLIWSDHNLVSMALYAGPTVSDGWEGHCGKCPRPYWSYIDHKGAVGWMGTGDMHLNVGRRCKAFLAHYRQLLDQVNVFALPHHGSARHFTPQLPNAASNAVQFVAAAGRNSYGHPSQDVVRIVRATGKEFVRVSEIPDTALEWRHEQ